VKICIKLQIGNLPATKDLSWNVPMSNQKKITAREDIVNNTYLREDYEKDSPASEQDLLMSSSDWCLVAILLVFILLVAIVFSCGVIGFMLRRCLREKSRVSQSVNCKEVYL